MTKKLLVACGMAAICTAPVVAGSEPVYPPFGLDLTAADTSTAPGDDFFQFANGTYLERIVIPPDEVMASRRNEMTARTEARLRDLLEEAAGRAPLSATDPEGQVGAYYAAFLNEKVIEGLGANAIASELTRIKAATGRSELAALMGESNSGFFPSIFRVGIDIDPRDSGRYAVSLGQSGLGLPDRDYYLLPRFAKQRAAYEHYAMTLLDLTGWPDPSASAPEVVAFEARIAAVSWDGTKLRDRNAQDNPMTPASLSKLAPRFDWDRFLSGAGLSEKTSIIVRQKDAVPEIAALFADTPTETIKAWMAFRVADSAAPYLSQAFTAARFEMRGRTLAGQTAERSRWRRGLEVVAAGDCFRCIATLKWPVGQLYVARHFPPATKARITALAQKVKAAFRVRLERLDWMSPETKLEAIRKLDKYVIKVGYPDRWRDYSAVVIRRDDLIGNARAIMAADWRFLVERSNGAVDRDDWSLAPQMNNAYNGSLGDIVFPAAILQAPLFDANADQALNYGAIGAVIGHELTHGFDDAGRNVDWQGVLRNWWTAADAVTFETRVARLGAQYAEYEPVPGTYIRPGLTMGENLADLGGLSIALDAYRASLGDKPDRILGGLTGEQRVFLGWAQAWAGKATADEILRLTTSDPHSYRKFRVNGVVRNIDAWYRAFSVKPGHELYLSPEERVRIW